jgi:hypothetical protein
LGANIPYEEIVKSNIKKTLTMYTISPILYILSPIINFFGFLYRYSPIIFNPGYRVREYKNYKIKKDNKYEKFKSKIYFIIYNKFYKSDKNYDYSNSWDKKLHGTKYNPDCILVKDK